MIQSLRSVYKTSLTLVLTIFLSISLTAELANACSEPPPLQPGVEVIQTDDRGFFFDIRLSGYSTFGGGDGSHFCTCGLSFNQTFGFEILEVVSARLVLAGTDMTFMTFDFGPDFDSTLGWFDVDNNENWQGLFATVNGTIDPNIPVDFVFSIEVDQFDVDVNRNSLGGGYSITDIRGALSMVASDEADANGAPTGGHQALFDVSPGQLPIELVDFGASLKASGVMLTWLTSAESNNSGFEVQHDSGTGFVDLGFVEGQGTTLEATDYQYFVSNVRPGVHRFRFNQIDFDGKSSFSPIVEVDVDLPGNHVVYAPYPNPFTSHVDIAYAVSSSQEVQIALFDILGKEMQSFSRSAEEGQTDRLRISTDGFPAGVYLVQVRGEDFKKTYTLNLVR